MRSLVILFLVLSASSTFAASSGPSSEAKASENEREFTVPVPQSEIKLEPLRYVPPTPVEFSFGASSYTPDNFTRGSYKGQVSKFEKSGVPSLSINRSSAILNWDNGFQIGTKFGLTYLSLGRTTDRTVGPMADGGSSTETLNIFMARVGFEAAWQHLLPGGFEPNFSLAILPTWIVGNKSQFEDTVGVFGFPYEASLGILWRAPRGNMHFGNLSFGISAQEVSGSVGNSSMTGFGVLGEMRVTL